jgi:hypothetical protein
MKKTLLVLAVLVLAFSAGYCRSRSTPSDSQKMDGKASRFSLIDPRVVISRIAEQKDLQEPEEKPVPAGLTAAVYSKAEQDVIDTVEDLKKAYDENKGRPDGFGIQIQQDIAEMLGKIRSRRSVLFLAAKLGAKNEILENKVKIAEALGNIGDGRATGALKTFRQYLKDHRPNDPMAGWSVDRWIKMTEDAITKTKADKGGK